MIEIYYQYIEKHKLTGVTVSAMTRTPSKPLIRQATAVPKEATS